MARREGWVPDMTHTRQSQGTLSPGGGYPRGRDSQEHRTVDYHPGDQYSGDQYSGDQYSGGHSPDNPLSAGLFVRTLRAFSGSVAAGLALLTAVVVVVAIVGGQRNFPGPGAVSITVHAVGTVAALVSQRWADRRRGLIAVIASLAVFALAGVVLWTQWWN